MEDWNDYQQDDPIDTRSGKPIYKEEEAHEEWKNPMEKSYIPAEENTSDDADAYEMVKVGRKSMPKALARVMKNGKQKARA